jgi:uncharacterized protein YdaU (DUF1376 family)
MNEDKKTRKAPAFQFYADDFLAGTADMSAEEVGGYIRLLCHQWSKGGIPSDEDRSARIAGLMGSPSIRYVLAKFTLCDGDTLKNVRLEQIRQEQADYKLKQAASGKTGAQKRWDKPKCDGNPNGVAIATPMATPMANAWRSDSSPSPSPTPNNKEESIAPKSQRSHFTVPTVEEVQAECVRIELAVLEAPKFVNYYESKGWVVGKTKMKSWKSALIGWKNRQIEFQQQRDRQQTLSIAGQSKTVLSENIADYL